MQGVAVVRFTPEMSRWEPETFVRTVLVDWLHVVEVWVGANFLFGHDREGNFTVLRTLGARYGFRAEKIDAVRYKDFVVSSTRVRRLVSEGRVDEAGALLGHHYFVDGVVVRGAGRGRELGFPTANLQSDERAAAAVGRVCDARRPSTASCMPSVTNIGMRPTFGDVAASGHRSAHLRLRARSLRSAAAAVVRAAAARRARVRRRRRAASADRGRLPQRAAAVRPDFAVESPICRKTRSHGPDSPALDLRLSVPAEGGLRSVAGELAAKIAQHLGTTAPDAQSLAAAVEKLAAQLGNFGEHEEQDITFSFRQVDGELVIEARRNDEASVVRHPLPS